MVDTFISFFCLSVFFNGTKGHKLNGTVNNLPPFTGDVFCVHHEHVCRGSDAEDVVWMEPLLLSFICLLCEGKYVGMLVYKQ